MVIFKDCNSSYQCKIIIERFALHTMAKSHERQLEQSPS